MLDAGAGADSGDEAVSSYPVTTDGVRASSGIVRQRQQRTTLWEVAVYSALGLGFLLCGGWLALLWAIPFAIVASIAYAVWWITLPRGVREGVAE